MRQTRVALAAAGAFAMLTSYAAAQRIESAPGFELAPAPIYTAQADEVPSPSDIPVAEEAPMPMMKYDGKDEKQDGKDCFDSKGYDSKGGYEDVVPCKLFPADNRLGIDIGGWTQLGYHNKDSYADLFNQNEDAIRLHQQWLYAERVADGSNGLDWGFRADLIYGIDADNTQAFGNNPGNWDFQNGLGPWGGYGWAIPQLYAELAYNDLSVIAGHFYTIIGYEVVPAPDNFFYSHAFTMNNSEPFTHTGVLATWGATDNLEIYGGWTAGWDTGFDQFNDGSSWLGGFSYALGENVTFTYVSTYGDFGFIGNGRDTSYSHSVVVDFSLTERLNYVFQSDMIDADIYDTVGINQYLFYNLNDCWAFGGRLEWWDNDGVSYNEATFGINYRPHTNLVLRPEVKQEWVPGLDLDQTIFGMDMVLTY
jgi:hypothetical protein